jgi:hypothetical protein
MYVRAYVAKNEPDFPHDGYTLLEKWNYLPRLISRAKYVFDQRVGA